jgi:hypothetical protein
MAAKSVSSIARNRVKKRTSIGSSVRSRPNAKGANKKRYRGQGK